MEMVITYKIIIRGYMHKNIIGIEIEFGRKFDAFPIFGKKNCVVKKCSAIFFLYKDECPGGKADWPDTDFSHLCLRKAIADVKF